MLPQTCLRHCHHIVINFSASPTLLLGECFNAPLLHYRGKSTLRNFRHTTASNNGNKRNSPPRTARHGVSQSASAASTQKRQQQKQRRPPNSNNNCNGNNNDHHCSTATTTTTTTNDDDERRTTNDDDERRTTNADDERRRRRRRQQKSQCVLTQPTAINSNGAVRSVHSAVYTVHLLYIKSHTRIWSVFSDVHLLYKICTVYIP